MMSFLVVQTICGGSTTLCALVFMLMFTVTDVFAQGAVNDAFPLLNADHANFVRLGSSKPISERKSDYLDTVTSAAQGNVFRFTSLPVTVFVNEFPDEDFMKAVQAAFDTWQHAGGGVVRFERVGSPDKARIQIQWKRLGVAGNVSACAAGAQTLTRFVPARGDVVPHFTVGAVPLPQQPKAGSNYSVAPQVIELNLDLIMATNPSIRSRLLRNIVTHELGHALGILGHSDDAGDMMFALTDEHSRLSERDVTTLRRLYQKPADVQL